MLQQGVSAVPLRWESQLQDSGPQETSSCTYQMAKISQRSPSQRQDPAPLNDQQATVLDSLCQTTNKTGTQTHPLAERLPKIIIRSQTPQNTPPDVDLPTRKTISSLIHQNTVSSTRKLTQPTEPTLATEDRHQKQRELRTCILQKGDPKHSKISKMRRQKNTLS